MAPPRKYLQVDEWKEWIEKEWKPLMQNHLPTLQRDMNWMKAIGITMLVALILNLLLK